MSKAIIMVRNRLDKNISTVYLEELMYDFAHVAFGGCPRNEFAYWREIWLRRGGDA